MMHNVYWVLGTKAYGSYTEFVRDVTEYCQEINPDDCEWEAEKVVCEGPKRISFEHCWELEDGETLPKLIISEGAITMGRLLYQVHNSSIDFFRDYDKHFFEGFREEKDVLVLLVGS